MERAVQVFAVVHLGTITPDRARFLVCPGVLLLAIAGLLISDLACS